MRETRRRGEVEGKERNGKGECERRMREENEKSRIKRIKVVPPICPIVQKDIPLSVHNTHQWTQGRLGLQE